jgi:hypothetical protein
MVLTLLPILSIHNNDTDSAPDESDNQDDDRISSFHRTLGLHHYGMVRPTGSDGSSFEHVVVLDPETAVQSHGMEQLASRDYCSSSMSF